jgi:hypothetical protein
MFRSFNELFWSRLVNVKSPPRGIEEGFGMGTTLSFANLPASFLIDRRDRSLKDRSLTHCSLTLSVPAAICRLVGAVCRSVCVEQEATTVGV